MESSVDARANWILKNNIGTTPDLNDDCSDLGQQNEPWQCDTGYFKRVVMSDVALLRMVIHASSNRCKSLLDLFKELDEGRKEMVGLLEGKVFGDPIVVTDACVLPIVDNVDVHSKLLDFFEARAQAGGSENVVGWYRTCTFGCLVTETDISTQMFIQKLKNPSFAVVIDSGSTIDICKVRTRAFRTYPDGYMPPEPNPRTDIPAGYLKKIKHLEKRYPLRVTYFKSSVDSNVFQDAWEGYWAHLIQSKSRRKTVHREVPAENEENNGDPIKFIEQYGSTAEALDEAYVKLVEEVGSSRSKISSPSSSFFFVILSEEQAKKLADHDCVKRIRPEYKYYADY